MTTYVPRVYLGLRAYQSVLKEGRVTHTTAGNPILDGLEQVILSPSLPGDAALREGERDLQLTAARHHQRGGETDVVRAIHSRLGLNKADQRRQRIEAALEDTLSLERRLGAMLTGLQATVTVGDRRGEILEIGAAELRGGELVLRLIQEGTDATLDLPLADVAIEGETAWKTPRLPASH